MRRLLAVILGLGLLLPVLITPPATAAPTRAQLTARADRLAFDVPLKKFMKVYRSPKKGVDKSFNWRDYDGCSLPRLIKPVAARWDKEFRRACMRHDFGYRNFGNGLALGSDQTHKSAIDVKFRSDMRAICPEKAAGRDLATCYAAAEAFYTGVSRFGKAQTAFFKNECTKARLCLFDDKSYEDRRITLSKSEDNMNDVDFGDKTSSVINRTGAAWVLYDDSGYGDRRFCIPPGVSVRDFGVDAYKFNDKVSSAKRMPDAKCPSGTPVIQEG